MGFLAKRKTRARMQPRHFESTLPFVTVTAEFRAVAEETEPLRGILSKGRRLYFERDQGVPTISWGTPVPGKNKPFVVPWAYWVVQLGRSSSGFTTTIVKASTVSGEISDFKRYVAFHDEFIERVAERDGAVQEILYET